MAGNISSVDKWKRLQEIKRLQEEDKTDQEIADITTLPIATVKRNIKYLKNLQLSDLKPEQIAEKRAEIYLELVEAGEEAKKYHDKYESAGTVDKLKQAKGYYFIWLKTIELKMTLYGLDKQKPETLVQVNNQYNGNTQPLEKVDYAIGERIANALKKSHEDKLQISYNKKQEIVLDNDIDDLI